MGSVRQVIDTDGDVANRYTYGPFGNIFTAETTETVDNAFTFTGQWYDEEINQYYLRARMYDPQLYRFTARDPYQGRFTEPLSLHPYLYCLNNPTNRIDPAGDVYIDISITGSLQTSLRGYGQYQTANRVKRYAEMLVSGVGMQQMIFCIAADVALDYAGGKVFGLAMKGAGKLASKAAKGAKALGRVVERNHVIPKFLTGADDGMLNGISRQLHHGKGKSWHNILRNHLKKLFGKKMPSNLSREVFEELLENSDNKIKASQALLDAAMEFDDIYGGDIMSSAVLEELINQWY